MANSSNSKKKFTPKGPKKPNYQVWVIVVLSALIFGVLYFNNSSAVKEISMNRFEDMMLSNDVKKVVLVKNQDYVEVYLKEEALQNSKYKNELGEKSAFPLGEVPHYKFNITSPEIFNEKFQKLEAQLPEDQRIGY